MPDYTVEQIRGLSGRELDAAVEWLCYPPRGESAEYMATVHPRCWSKNMNLAVTLLKEGGPLENTETVVYECVFWANGTEVIRSELGDDGWQSWSKEITFAEHSAVAICRAACIVKLTEGER